MAINRRGLLRAMPAMPFAARAAKEQVAQQLAGIGTIENSIGEKASYGTPMPANTYDPESNYSMDQLRRLLKTNGAVKEEVRRQIADEFRHVRYIDHDIAQKCWSLSVKIQHQRQRNIEFELQRWIDDDLFEKRSSSVYDVMRKCVKKYFLG